MKQVSGKEYFDFLTESPILSCRNDGKELLWYYNGSLVARKDENQNYFLKVYYLDSDLLRALSKLELFLTRKCRLGLLEQEIITKIRTRKLYNEADRFTLNFWRGQYLGKIITQTDE